MPLKLASSPYYLLFLLPLLSVITIIGNALVIAIVLKDPNRNLKTLSIVFLINLAAADLILGLVIEPMYALILFTPTHRRADALKDISYGLGFAVEASCLSLIALAIERWIVVEFPLRAHQLFTPKRVKITIAMIWITSALIAFLPYISLAFGYQLSERYYDIFLYDIVGSLLVITMVCVYGRICVLVRRSSNFREPSTADGDERTPLVANSQSQTIKRARIGETKVTKTCFIVCCVFIVCWLPARLCIDITDKDDTVVYKVCFIVGLINSALNPLIYSLRSAKFKQALQSMLQRSSSSNQT